MTAALPMSCRAYAKRRGVNPNAVSEAIKAGRLRASLTRDQYGSPKIADPELADREWEANTDHTDSPQRTTPSPSPAGPPVVADQTIGAAAARSKHWEAKLKELKYREAAKELVPVRDVERRLVDTFTNCKTRLLAVPSRARQALPHLSAADGLILENLIREALEDLAMTAVPS